MDSQTRRAKGTAATPLLLWISDAPIPHAISEAVLGRYRLEVASPADPLGERAQKAQAALIYPVGHDVRRISSLLDELDRTSLVGLLLLSPDDPGAGQLVRRQGQFATSSVDAAPEIISAQLSALLQIQPAVQTLHHELAQIRTFGQDIGATFDQIDEEMRLAARLQRDFLPKHLPSIGPVRFSALFRPATWVSGDIYDVLRLDEDHVAFYVADVVGHGLPAALLTMFIKRALPTKRIAGHRYAIVSPDSAMTELNEAICAQGLTSCQFCTAVYAIINVRSLELTFSRAGHPQPIVLGADGGTRELESSGGLLGIFPEEQFALGTAQLVRGDRLVLHSDGAEAVFRRKGSSGRQEFLAAVEQCRNLSAEEMALSLTGAIDQQQGSLHPEDDVTILVMEVTKA